MIDWLIFVLIVSLFGILVGLLYQTIKVENVNKIIRLISGIACLILVYYSFFNKYFLIPLIIIAVCLPFKKNFSAISFFSNFGGVLALIFSILKQTKADYLLFSIVLALFFNSLLSIFSIAIETQQSIERTLKTKKKEFELKPPFYYLTIFYALNLIALLGVILSLARQTYYLALLLFLVFLIFSAALLLIKSIKIAQNKITIRNILKKEEINFNQIKKATLTIVPGGWSMPTNILELQLKDKIERIDIRTHYNNKDTSEFIAVLKKQLGKKLKENQE